MAIVVSKDFSSQLMPH